MHAPTIGRGRRATLLALLALAGEAAPASLAQGAATRAVSTITLPGSGAHTFVTAPACA